MTKLITRFSLLLTLLFITGSVMAQDPFYSEDFSNDSIPDGWMTVDTSGNEVVWQHCSTPESCPPATFVSAEGAPFFGPFAAATADNGYVFVDSDAAGELDTNHVSRLTSTALDAADKAQVFLRFDTHIATFANNAAANAIVRVRTGSGDDASEWTSYTLFPTLTTDGGAQTSANATKITLDISDAAAMSDEVYIQWQWTGAFEFSWSLDDVQLFATEPSSAPENSVYYEDFGDGAAGWELVNIMPEDMGWEYYPVPDVGNGAFAAAGTIIQSLTPENGAMVLNYDFLNTQGDGANAPAFPYPDFISELISPVIDLSDVDEPLSLEFSQLFRRLNNAPQQFFSSVSISRDGGLTYEDPIDANPNVGANDDAVSTREIIPIRNIAGEDSLRIKFTYAGDFYFWAVDDITLATRPPNDLQANENFFAVAINAQTPISQIEPINFLLDIENVGGKEQTNVEVDLTILNSDGDEVFNTTEEYGTITTDSTAENRVFVDNFTPSTDQTDVYTGVYTVSGDAEDSNIENNALTFSFAVTDTTFAKETGATSDVTPADDESYTYGNVFYVPNGDDYFARYLSFSVGNASDLAAAGKSVTTYLYKWNGNGGDALSIAPEDLEVLAFNSHTFTGDEGAGLITLPVDLDGNAIQLESGTFYIPAIEYSTDDETNMRISVSRERNYQAAYFVSDSLQVTRFASALDVGNSGTLGLVGFGFGIVPVIRLHIGDNADISKPGITVPTDVLTVLPADNKVAIFPNPVQENLQLNIDLAETSNELFVKIFDNTGRLVMDNFYENIQRTDLNYSVKNLAGGTYFLQVVTDAGVRTKRFVVQR